MNIQTSNSGTIIDIEVDVDEGTTAKILSFTLSRMNGPSGTDERAMGDLTWRMRWCKLDGDFLLYRSSFDYNIEAGLDSETSTVWLGGVQGREHLINQVVATTANGITTKHVNDYGVAQDVNENVDSVTITQDYILYSAESGQSTASHKPLALVNEVRTFTSESGKPVVNTTITRKLFESTVVDYEFMFIARCGGPSPSTGLTYAYEANKMIAKKNGVSEDFTLVAQENEITSTYVFPPDTGTPEEYDVVEFYDASDRVIECTSVSRPMICRLVDFADPVGPNSANDDVAFWYLPQDAGQTLAREVAPGCEFKTKFMFLDVV